VLYGLAEARKLLATAPPEAPAPLVVVEGYMDVIACHRASIAAVAPMGTALTEGQMELLWRFHPEPTLCFDGDKAGQRAAGRAIERALPHIRPGRSFRFTVVEGGKDPDDVLREQGAGVLKAQIANTSPFVEKLFNQAVAEAGSLDTPEQKTALKASLRKLASTIQDPDLAKAYREDLLGRFEALWPTSQPVYTVGAAGRELSRARWEKRKAAVTGASDRGKAAAVALKAQPKPLAAALAVAAIQHPSMLMDSIERVASSGFGDPSLDLVAHELVALSFEGDRLDSDTVRRRLAAKGLDAAVFDKLLRAAGKARAAFLDPELSEQQAKALWVNAYEALMHLDALERAVDQAKQDIDRDQDFATLSKLKAERDALSRAIASGEWSVH
jgi:DNA primase